MSSPRLRPAPSPAGEDTVTSLPAGPPPLAGLRDKVASHGAEASDVEALLAAMALPPSGAETPRERADVLLTLLDAASPAGDRTGADGRTVRAAALEALLSLGYPYAMEVPPEVLEQVREEQPVGGRPFWRRPASKALTASVTVLAALAQAGLVIFTTSFRGVFTNPFYASLMAAALLPALAALLGTLRGWRGLQWLGSKALGIEGTGWAFLAAAIVERGHPKDLSVALLLPWHLCLYGAYLASPPKARKTPESAPASPPKSE